MKRKLIQIIGFAALAGLTTASAAQTNQRPDGRSIGVMLLSFDLNNDGTITRDEARNGLTQRFASMDANGDGTVTRQERRGSRRAARFQAMDVNGDGLVTLPEMEAATQRRIRNRFARMDTNGDGALTQAELQAHSARRGNRGSFTLQDLDARAMRMFDRIDQNGDGTISPDEAKAIRHNGRRN